ncbi:MAG: hypothetical protein WD231_03795 [Candidatus Woykebacteria bacterium]
MNIPAQEGTTSIPETHLIPEVESAQDFQNQGQPFGEGRSPVPEPLDYPRPGEKRVKEISNPQPEEKTHPNLTHSEGQTEGQIGGSSLVQEAQRLPVQEQKQSEMRQTEGLRPGHETTQQTANGQIAETVVPSTQIPNPPGWPQPGQKLINEISPYTVPVQTYKNIREEQMRLISRRLEKFPGGGY